MKNHTKNRSNTNKVEQFTKMVQDGLQQTYESGSMSSMKAPTDFDKAQILYAFLTMKDGNFTEVNFFGDKRKFNHQVLGPMSEVVTFTRETAPDFYTFYAYYEDCPSKTAQCVWESSNGGRVSLTSFRDLDFVVINLIGEEKKRIEAEFDNSFNEAFERMLTV